MKLPKFRKPVVPPPGRHVRMAAAPKAAPYSYYNNPRSERPPVPAASNQRRPETTLERRPVPSRFRIAQLPLAIGMLVVVICLVKLLTLNTQPKVVLLSTSSTASRYLQPSRVYQAAATKQLRTSVMNRLKLTANVNGVSKSLEQQFPELASVSVTVPLIGNRPIIYVLAAEPSIILQAGTANYVLNEAGLALTTVATPPSGSIFVRDQASVVPTLGKQALSGSTVQFIQTVAYQLRAAQVPIASFTLSAQSAYELDAAVVGKPYQLKFNLQTDAKEQSGAAVATIAKLGATNPSSYIDLRVPGRIYYK